MKREVSTCLCVGNRTLLMPAAREFGADATAHYIVLPIGRDASASRPACNKSLLW
jgi:hypothetical protein